jgi:hypothetical protein
MIGLTPEWASFYGPVPLNKNTTMPYATLRGGFTNEFNWSQNMHL